MAADRQRLAQALAAEAARRRMFESIPEAAGQGLPQAPEATNYGRDLENLSIGLGRGAVNQLEGLKGLITSPVESLKGMATGAMEAVRNPRMIAEALKRTGERGMSGPLGLGEVIGENVNIMRMPGKPVISKTMQMRESSPVYEKIQEKYKDFAQAYNLGIPDTPIYRQIVKEVNAESPLSDESLINAIKAHPKFLQAKSDVQMSKLKEKNRVAAATAVKALSDQGVEVRTETSKALGSKSTYIYAKTGDKPIKLRFSDHPPSERRQIYGANDISTTPQHWKSAVKNALTMLNNEVVIE